MMAIWPVGGSPAPNSDNPVDITDVMISLPHYFVMSAMSLSPALLREGSLSPPPLAKDEYPVTLTLVDWVQEVTTLLKKVSF